MIIPIGTDAPIYHWPIATVGMIVVNSALYLLFPAAYETSWALELGSGIHPVQWVTHNFLHIGLMHLVGNMIFLWAFGIIVEGKLGALAFLAVYLAVGTCHGAFVQLLSLRGAETSAVGASAVIFGLLAMCMVWAPKNDLTCFVLFGGIFRFYADTWDIPIVMFALFDIGCELATLAFRGLTGFGYITTAIGHLSGALWGFLAATLLLKLNWVDCENWDLYTVMAGKQGQAKKGKRKKKKRKPPEEADAFVAEDNGTGGGTWTKTPETKATEALRRIETFIKAGDAEMAQQAYVAARGLKGWDPSEATLLGLIKEFHSRKAWVPSIPVMRDYCRRFPAKANRVRLRLAQILIRDQQRPALALRLLSEIPSGSLDPQLDQARDVLVRQAAKMQEEGILELEGED
jgi:membrane associated rhomboid family serine protease